MIESAVWNEEELSTIQNKDRLLPVQPYFSKMYKGADFYGDLERVLSQTHCPTFMKIATKEGVTYSVLGSDFNTLAFFQFLIRSHGYKKVLELGTYIGVSAMHMAAAGAEVTTVEKGEEFYNIARTNIVNNGYGDRIKSVNSDAIKFLEDCYLSYDLIFIDCAKESYKELLVGSMLRLAINGMILVDDVFFQGDTLNEVPTSEKGVGVRKMLDYVAALDGWEKVILPIGNGLLMLRRI